MTSSDGVALGFREDVGTWIQNNTTDQPTNQLSQWL